MIRAACAVLGTIALFSPSIPRPDVDAVTFATAFRAGEADQYKSKQISGTGVSFHGAISERLADGSTRSSLVVTLGTVAQGGKVDLIKTWDDFVAAERDRTTLVVALSGPDLPSPPPADAVTYDFSGVYDGQVRTIMRAPLAAASSASGATDSGPCPGEEARQPAEPAGAFYCAPLLTGALATQKEPR
jgi:hypothetical protein